jgi:dTDP-4-amino-4,6-dideoxygalactose transaminase
MGQSGVSVGDVKPIDSAESGTDVLAVDGGTPVVGCRPTPLAPINADELKAAIAGLIDAGIFSDVAASGPLARAEREFAEFIGVPYALSFSSGTAALTAAYAAAQIGPGDEVLHPCYSWISSIAPAVHRGARPVFCEIEERSLLLDPDDIERRITRRTTALTIVHMHGNVCDARAIAVARRHGLFVIEDCSHSHGATAHGQRCGSVGDIGCFSLQGSPVDGKPVAAGEGGFAVTRSRVLYERMLLSAHINRWPMHGSFEEAEWDALRPYNLGLKSRAHPWAIACASLMMRSLEGVNDRKRQVRQLVAHGLASIDALALAQSAPATVPAGFYGGLNIIYRPERAHNTPVELVRRALAAEGVIVGGAPYPLLHKLPFFANPSLVRDAVGPAVPLDDLAGPDSLRVSESVHERVINVLHPFNVGPEDPYVVRMVDAFIKVFAHIDRHEGLRPRTPA